MNNFSHPSELKRLSGYLLDGLRAELYLTPKPGLVDLRNSGSHKDLSLELMIRSIRLMEEYLDQLLQSLEKRVVISELRAIGLEAEKRMYRQLKTNCHRGGIFLCGLLLAAARQAPDCSPENLRTAVISTAEALFEQPQPSLSHGQAVRRRYPQAGIIAECLDGLPALFEIVLPTFKEHGINGGHSPFLVMARLMQYVEDSTTLFRGGGAGLSQLRSSGYHLENCILSGEDPAPLLRRLDDEFRQKNLTMGGVADLLGLGLGYTGYLLDNCAGKSPELSPPALATYLKTAPQITCCDR